MTPQFSTNKRSTSVYQYRIHTNDVASALLYVLRETPRFFLHFPRQINTSQYLCIELLTDALY